MSPQRKPVHEIEHAIEVVLPFLQIQLGQFKLVPIVVGSLESAWSHQSDSEIGSVASSLRSVMDERTLLVVASNFTNYGDTYHYTPFTTDIPAQIERLDQRAFDPILRLDRAAFQAYLDETQNPIDGIIPIHILMGLMPPTATGVLLAHDTSGSKMPNQATSVSYAAIAFYDRGLPPLEPVVGAATEPSPTASAPAPADAKASVPAKVQERKTE